MPQCVCCTPRLCVQELGADVQQLVSCLCRQPGLLMADHASSTQPRLAALRAFGFDPSELLQLVLADPVVLTLSTSSLTRKWEFLTQQMGLGKQQVLQQCPSYFSKPLVCEIGPRYSFVVQQGLQGCFTCRQGLGHQQLRPEQQGQQQPQPGEQQPPLLPPPGSQAQGAATVQGQQPAPSSQQRQQQQVHLGLLLEPPLPEFLRMLGQAGAAADEYEAHVQHWAQTEGLRWTAARVT